MTTTTNDITLPGLCLLAGVLIGCTPELPPQEQQPPELLDAQVEPGYPQIEACRAREPEPTHLLVTSTDFTTGAVGLIDLRTHTVMADLALASSDAVPVVLDDRAFVINRYGFDYVDELDLHAGLELIHEWPIEAATVDTPSNPHALSLDPSGHAWVSLHGAPELQRFTFPSLQAAAVTADFALDLSSFADADGVPELSLLIGCGPIMFASAERIDRDTWVPVATTTLIPVRTQDPPALFEWDLERPGVDGIELLGAGVGSWRLDPADASGRTILLLNSGLERIDLAAGTSAWVVSEQVFEDAGYDRLQLSGFDLDADGQAWISAARADFAEFSLLRVDLSGATPSLIVEVEGLQSSTGALEIAGHTAYFADTTIGASGVRMFDLESSPVSELPDSPLAVGLPPMGLAPIKM